MKVAACSIARNESRDIGEWLLYHFLIGFDMIILFDHLSDDDTGGTARRAAAGSFDLRLLRWNSDHQSPQDHAYRFAYENFGKAFDWMFFIDTDEFFVPARHKTVHEFLREFRDESAIAINWLCYGSSGHLDFPGGLVTESFTHRSVNGFSANRHVKVFVRPEFISGVSNNPHYFSLNDGARYVDAEKHEVRWLKPGKTESVRGTDIARINHYFTRSRAHFLEKLRRPVACDIHQKRADDFNAYDRNEIFDPIIPTEFPAVIASIEEKLAKEKLARHTTGMIRLRQYSP